MEILIEIIKVLAFIGLILFSICWVIKKFSDFRRCNGYGRIYKQEYLKKIKNVAENN